MKEESSKVSFWAYDIFGYLLPGLVLIAGYAKSNIWVYDNIHIHWTSGSYADYAIILGVAYTVGHIVSGLSSLILERLLLRRFPKYPTYQMFKPDDDTPKKVKIFFPGYFRPYSKEFQKSVRDKIKTEFNIDDPEEHDLFWLCWSYICLNHPVAYKRATHFLELYGFSRNMSMSFLLLVPATWFASWTDTMNGYVWSFGTLFSAWILFVNYTKLLRRLNDEVYRAFVVASKSS
jgi:hypothetical protein